MTQKMMIIITKTQVKKSHTQMDICNYYILISFKS